VPRIIGVDIPKDKKVGIALTYIHGIGKVRAGEILKKANVNLDARAKDLTEEEISRIAAVIQKEYPVEGDLRRLVSQNIRRLIDIGSYRGFRHRRSLPVRGQRTRTNARTRKGPRKTVGARKVKPEKAVATNGAA
jgi:small subunit ribosomal protein S13